MYDVCLRCPRSMLTVYFSEPLSNSHRLCTNRLIADLCHFSTNNSFNCSLIHGRLAGLGEGCIGVDATHEQTA